MHLNHESQLPPVNCPLLIKVGDELLKAHRPTFVESKGNELTYVLEDGSTLSGNFPWTYP